MTKKYLENKFLLNNSNLCSFHLWFIPQDLYTYV